MHDVESKVFVVTELPAVMATIYFSVFHSVLVPYFRMKAGASEVKTEEQHSTQWFCSESPVFTRNWCNLVKWLTISNSSLLCCCFPMTTNWDFEQLRCTSRRFTCWE